MDYKKAYEDALERAKSAIKECGDNKGRITMIESIFPELAESDDEKIKKAIVKMISDIDGGFPFEKHGIIKKKALAWLERQGEKQDYNPYKATIESIAAMVERYANGDLKDFYDNVKVKCKDAIEYDNTWLEKQGEQKPVDKVEPKFKVGDIITNKKSKDTVKIVQILHDSYCYSGWNGAATVHSDFNISEQDDWELVEQKSAWSEEDEKIFNEIFSVVEKAFSRKCTLFGESYDYIKWQNWLKSLKPHWKPNDEQMQSLYFAIITYSKKDDCKFTYDGLNSLYDDLKKTLRYDNR